MSSTYFHLPFKQAGDVSAGPGMPAGGNRLDECTAMRNIYDWLYSIKRDGLDGREVHGHIAEWDRTAGDQWPGSLVLTHCPPFTKDEVSTRLHEKGHVWGCSTGGIRVFKKSEKLDVLTSS